MMFLPVVRGEIEFKSTERYTCPTCGFSTTIVPCVGCFARQAKERQKVRKGDQPGTSPVNLPELAKSDARDAAGKAVGVSGKSIDYARQAKASQQIPQLVGQAPKRTGTHSEGHLAERLKMVKGVPNAPQAKAGASGKIPRGQLTRLAGGT